MKREGAGVFRRIKVREKGGFERGRVGRGVMAELECKRLILIGFLFVGFFRF